MSSDSTLANITREQWQHYVDTYGGVEERMANDVNSTEMIRDARSISATQNRLGQALQARSISRRGLNMTPAQRQAMEKNQSYAAALSSADAVNNARVNQRERNISLGNEMAMIGRKVNSDSYNGLGTAASLEASRNSANAQAKASSKASTLGAITSIGSAMLIGGF